MPDDLVGDDELCIVVFLLEETFISADLMEQ